MPEPSVIIIGAGIAATAVARELVSEGLRVTIFEVGPQYPYPPTEPFLENKEYLVGPPTRLAPEDLSDIETDGDYPGSLKDERFMRVGGTATGWSGITLRFCPEDFRMRTAYRRGADWPLDYDELEPYYGFAEQMLGVSGTDDDNPFAPSRSTPFPLPPFEFAYDDKILRDRLKDDVVIHSVPQARTHRAYDGRPACVNMNSCHVCPIGARYHPNHHLQQLVAGGRCTLHADASVRRIITDDRGRATAVLVRHLGEAEDREYPADVVIVAAGAVATARLLLLSTSPQHPDGLGNHAGLVGRYFMLHHGWRGHLDFAEKLWSGRTGFPTAESHQFLRGDDLDRRGSIKVEFLLFDVEAHLDLFDVLNVRSGRDVVALMQPLVSCRSVVFSCEPLPQPENRIELSSDRDRHDDPLPRVRYELADFDYDTYEYVRTLFERIRRGSGAASGELHDVNAFSSLGHHLGGCRMSDDPNEGVVDAFGKVHGTENVYVAGAATYVTGSAVNPALTIVALALRLGQHLARKH